ncbi:MAG: hypothetical protein KJ579_05995, partial [Verrucomicrobia bacterium]|nr:hypothetical protein [Verrucomicrobiota bacterium]
MSPVVAGGADPGLPARGGACFAGLAAPDYSRVAMVAVLLAAGGCVGAGGDPDGRTAGWIYSSATGVEPSELVESRNWPAPDGLPQTLELRRRTTDGRRFYVCRAWLDVCGSAEAVCKAHRFDALFQEDGAFIGYRVALEHPFTKAEHDPFRPRDYGQLDAILRNPGHALADLPPPRRAARPGANGVAGIDGLTGATIAHYAGQAVPHAFYTSHAVWHLVNRSL